jgi:hypothetical protein
MSLGTVRGKLPFSGEYLKLNLDLVNSEAFHLCHTENHTLTILIS